MRISIFSSVGAAAVCLAVCEAASIPTTPQCEDICFSIPVNTTGMVAPATPLTAEFSIDAAFTLNARYCEPANFQANSSDTLQLLVHGITYNRNFWSGLDLPGFQGNNYSWIAYAAERNYPTLSLDRLGHGLSDRPDPTSIVQNQIQVDLMHGLVEQIKRGTGLPRSYRRIVYVGHSQGSLIGVPFVNQYPGDVDAVVLTGWSTLPAQGNSVIPSFAPASSLFLRYATLAPGYVSAANVAAREPFYSVPGRDFDPAILQYDYDREDITTTGVTFTSLPQTTNSSFAGDVYVLTGQLDSIFCGSTGDCGQGEGAAISQQRRFFPRARSYSYFVPPQTGHNFLFHYSQRDSFANVMDWMQQKGF